VFAGQIYPLAILCLFVVDLPGLQL